MAQMIELDTPELGLVTWRRPHDIPIGACQAGSQNFAVGRGRVASFPGSSRLTKNRPDAHTIKLAGQYFRGKVEHASTIFARNDTTQTMRFLFRVDRMGAFMVMAYKGQGEGGTNFYDFTKFDWSIVMLPNGTISYAASTGAALLGPVAIGTDGDGKPIVPGQWYSFAVVHNSPGANKTQLYLQRIGSSNQGVANSGTATIGATSTNDVFFGGMPRGLNSTWTSNATTRQTLAKHQFQGVIQEIALWDDDLSAADIESVHDAEIDPAMANLVALYRLSGDATDTYYYESLVGSTGSGSGECPRLEIEPRDAAWIDTGHVLGNPITGYDQSVAFNGRSNAIYVPDSYQYRSATIDSQRRLGTRNNLWQSTRFRVGKRRERATLFHWSHVPQDFRSTIARKATARTTSGDVAAGATTGSTSLSLLAADNSINRAAGSFVTNGFEPGQRIVVTGFTTNGSTFYAVVETVAALKMTLSGVTLVDEVAAAGRTATASVEFTWYLETVDVGAGVYEFAFVCAYEVAGPSIRIATVVSNTGGIADNTEYDVTCTFDLAAAQIRIQVGASVSVTQSLSSPVGLVQTTNVPDISNRKYAMNFGVGVYRLRKMNGFESNPNFFEMEYDYTKAFDGVIGHSIIGSSATVPAGSGATADPHNIIRNTETIDHTTISAIAGQVLSAWKFDAGNGNTIYDIGLLTNNIPFKSDTGHTWGVSGIATEAREEILGIFEQQFTDYPTNVSRIVATAGGAAYEVNASTGALTLIGDGLRNDDRNEIQATKFRNTMILCCGSPVGNFQLLKDQIVNLSIAKPEGITPRGVANQLDEKAGLEEGDYKIAIAFYSKSLDKWSELSEQGTVSLFPHSISAAGYQGRANIVLGTAAEINQYPATLTTVPATGPDRGKEPFGVTGGSRKAILTRSYLSSETAPQKDKEVVLGYSDVQAHPFMNDSSDATGQEWMNVWENYNPRLWCRALPDGRFEVNTRFTGSEARLRLADGSTSVATNDFGASPITASGSGITGHGLTIQSSFDPQVTHVGIFRTVAGGSVYRLEEMIENGTTDYTMSTPDSELQALTIDPSIGPMPGTKLAVDFGDRMYFAVDPLNEEAFYFSEPATPWALRTGNVTLLQNGESNPITGIARTEDTLTFMKRNEIFVGVQTTDPNFPIQLRMRVVSDGCVAPFGIVNHESRFYLPTLNGFAAYDTGTMTPLALGIEPTVIDKIGTESRNKTHAVYDRKNRRAMFFVASGDSFDSHGRAALDQVFAWDVDAKRGPDGEYYGWMYATGIYATTVARVHDPDGQEMILIANPMGYIDRFDTGSNHGLGPSNTALAHPALAAGGFTTSRLKVAAIDPVAFPEGYVGLQVTVIKTSDGTRYQRLVVADDQVSPNSLIDLDHELPFTPSETNCTVVVGSIDFEWKSGDLPTGYDIGTARLQRIHAMMTPKTPAHAITLKVRGMYGYDDGDAAGQGADQEITLGGDGNASGNADYSRTIGFGDQIERGSRFRVGFKAMDADAPFEFNKLSLEIENSGRAHYTKA